MSRASRADVTLRRLAPGTCFSVGVFLALTVAQFPTVKPRDMKRFMQKAREAQERDLDAWDEFTFRRHVLREKRDDEGRLDYQDRWIFEITPSGDGFDELLVTIDGRAPTSREVRHHAKRAKFTDHYRQVSTGSDGQGDSESGFSFNRLLQMPAYRYQGIEEVDGIPCHVLTFDPVPEGDEGDLADRFSWSLGGKLWMTRDGLHLYKAEAVSQRPLSIGLGIAKIHRVWIRFQARQVEEGIWLPWKIEVTSEGRVVLSPFRKHNLYIYDRYKRLRR